MDHEVTNAKNFFLSHDLHLSDEWLASCLEWCHEKNRHVTLTTNDLHKQVYNQWLFLDLREVNVPVLPPNLSQEVKTTLTKTYYLQMMYVVDISKPKYWQLLRLRGTKSFRLSDIDAEPCNSNRMLQLALTDGVQEIHAIELKPIPSLHLNLTPGVKLQIIGPLTVRRGRIMLEEKNVLVLGGEVEELAVENAAENAMARAVGLPQNPNPNNVQENDDTSNLRTQTVSSNDRDENETRTINNPPQNCSNVQRLQDIRNSNYISTEEEQRLVEEVDMLLNAENLLQNEPRNNFNESKKAINSSLKNRNEAFNQSNATTFEFSEDDDDLFENMDIDAHLDLIDEKQKQETISKKITPISEVQLNKGKGEKFTLRAKFKSILTKLTIADKKWHMKLSICDDTGDLAVLLHTDVVAKLAGLPAIEMENLILDKRNSKALHKIQRVIVNLTKNIRSLEAEMMIEYNEKELPCVIDIN